MKKNVILVFLAGVFLNSLFAHDWFAAVSDTKAYKSGNTVTLYVYSTHKLFVGDIMPNRSGNIFYVLQNNKVVDARVTSAPDETLKVLKATFALPAGAPSMVVVNRTPGVSSTTTSGGYMPGTKATLQALGVSVGKSSYSEGWCKVYVNPSPGDTSFSTPLGLPLEIVPVTNPADMAVGKTAVFKVLLNGRALPNVEISATYKKYNTNEEDAWAVKNIKTNASGEASIAIPNNRDAKDLWIVKASYTRPISNSPYYDTESFTSLVSFNVTK
ncbi:MAG: DUF4198 domain-containing protein [Spirochaetaceae bacterium]|jgi:uncharacterized GH25 family protein|nr:DUF4198 domain-containing protein [Spirochaetaceae bacterium]